jgi:hypothetical protein
VRPLTCHPRLRWCFCWCLRSSQILASSHGKLVRAAANDAVDAVLSRLERPVHSLLQCVASLIGRAVLQERLLTSLLMQSAVGTLANLAQREEARAGGAQPLQYAGPRNSNTPLCCLSWLLRALCSCVRALQRCFQTPRSHRSSRRWRRRAPAAALRCVKCCWISAAFLYQA